MDLIATITDKFLDAVTSYLGGLDWTYMISLMLLMNVINVFFPDHIYKLGKIKFSFPTKYRVPVLAVIMVCVSYKFHGGLTKAEVIAYFQSMLAAMVLYLWFLAALMKALAQRVPIIGEILDKMKVVKTSEKKK